MHIHKTWIICRLSHHYSVSLYFMSSVQEVTLLKETVLRTGTDWCCICSISLRAVLGWFLWAELGLQFNENPSCILHFCLYSKAELHSHNWVLSIRANFWKASSCMEFGEICTLKLWFWGEILYFLSSGTHTESSSSVLTRVKSEFFGVSSSGPSPFNFLLKLYLSYCCKVVEILITEVFKTSYC